MKTVLSYNRVVLLLFIEDNILGDFPFMSKKLRFSKRSNLYWDDYNNYLFELLKEVIPRQLVKCVEYDIILKSESLIQHVNSITDTFNIMFDYHNDFPKIREDVEKILKNRYGYVIKQDNPFIMKKVSDDNE